MFRLLSVFALLLSISSLAIAEEPPEANSPLDVYGLWQLESGAVDVRVADCGDGTPCGSMARVQSDQDGEAVDRFNPDPEKASEPLVGLVMLEGFRRGKTSWKNGSIYNAKNGKTYRSNIKLREDGTLQVKGCVGPICRTQIWTRIG